MENSEKQKSEKQVTEPITQIKQMIESRINDYNIILTKLKEQNDEAATKVLARLDSIASSSMELGAKKKFIGKINRYLSIILYENEDIKVKPEKARLKDLEKLATYFSIIDDVLTKIENKIDDKIADQVAEAEHKPEQELENITDTLPN